MSTLPIHPQHRHPLTGEPIRALWVRPDGRVMWPILGASEDGGGSGGDGGSSGGSDGGQGGSQGSQGAPKDNEAYLRQELQKWRGRAESNYGLLQTLGVTNADEATALKGKAEKHDALEHELMSDKDKAVTEATQAAKTEADEMWKGRLAESAFRLAIGDRNARTAEADRMTDEQIDSFIADLNLARFLTDDGKVDTSKVLERVDQFAPKGTAQQATKGPKIPGPGARAGGSGSNLTGLSGSELYDRLHPKKSA
jgi:hypothetical protein